MATVSLHSLNDSNLPGKQVSLGPQGKLHAIQSVHWSVWLLCARHCSSSWDRKAEEPRKCLEDMGEEHVHLGEDPEHPHRRHEHELIHGSLSGTSIRERHYKLSRA